jgi:uncharacterized protein (TIGR01777 family)
MDVTAKRIVIAGGSGFVGRRLVRRLLGRKDLVTVLSRNPVAARSALPEAVRIAGYTPNTEGPWFDELAQTDAVVSLAGEQVVGVRWSSAKKKEFEDSRIGTNHMLVKAIERIPKKHRPKMIFGASGVGYYGPHGPTEQIDETGTPGRDYMALLAQRWEEALAPAAALGVRVVRGRFGIVLGKGGGAIEKMARPFRMHVGGPIGSGQQMVSWVHIDDVCGMILFAIDKEELSGPMNVTAPSAVNMDQFCEAIGVILHRRSYLRVPEGAVKALFGEGAEPLLTGVRARPKVAEAMGYEFQYPELLSALESVLGPD